MSPADPDLHPGPVELLHYVRGTLSRGHAAAVLAHCVVCDGCATRLTEMLPCTPREPGDSGDWFAEPTEVSRISRMLARRRR